METLAKLWVRIRKAMGALSEAQTAWAIAINFGLPAAGLLVLRHIWTWWTTLDTAGQWLAGTTAFLFLYAVSVTLWQTLGKRVVQWIQGRVFPVLLRPVLAKPSTLFLHVENRRRAANFRVVLTSMPGHDSAPLPLALPWYATGERDFRRIVRRGSDNAVLGRLSFLNPIQTPLGLMPLLFLDIEGSKKSIDYAMLKREGEDHYSVETDITIQVQTEEQPAQRFVVSIKGMWFDDRSVPFESAIELRGSSPDLCVTRLPSVRGQAAFFS